ncbi:hypothetical protein [Thermincola ferriacetica]
MSNTKSLAKAASVIMVATLVGRFVGFIREMVIANQFGASAHTDAYVVAYTIPSMVAMALAGAFNAAFCLSSMITWFPGTGEKQITWPIQQLTWWRFFYYPNYRGFCSKPLYCKIACAGF